MVRITLLSLFLGFCSISYATPVTHLLYGQSESFELIQGGGFIDKIASNPLYRNDGGMYFNGNTFAVGSITIDQDLLTPALWASGGWLTGGVTWAFATEGVGFSSHFPSGGPWPLTRFSANSIQIYDEWTSSDADIFVLTLNFTGTPFQSTFSGGTFGFNNYQNIETPDGSLSRLTGSIDGLIPFRSAVVSEPSPIALLGAGLASLAFVRRRRN